MRKNHFWVLILLLLMSAIILPVYKNQEKEKTQDKQTNIPAFEQGVNPINCDSQLTQTNSDDLSSLLANQDSQANNCLFLGCNGFF